MKGKFKRAWTSEGLDRSGTEGELYLREFAPNMAFAASLPTHSRPSTIDWCNMQVRLRPTKNSYDLIGKMDRMRERRLRLQAGGNLIGTDRPTAKIALIVVTLDALQELQLCRFLDALGADGVLQRVRQIGHGRNQCLILA